MPDIDGWSVYQRLKKSPLLSQIPVIIITIGDYEKMAKDLSGKSQFLKYDGKSPFLAIFNDFSDFKKIIKIFLFECRPNQIRV